MTDGGTSSEAPLLERYCQHTPGLTTLSQRWGTLRLYDDRLEWKADSARRSWSEPLTEIHSPRNFVGGGITFYRRDERMKFDLSYRDPVEAFGAAVRKDNAAAYVLDHDRDQDERMDAAEAARVWTAALEARAADPPAGVRVRHTFGPDQRGLYTAIVLVIIVVIVILLGFAIAAGIVIAR